MHADARWHLKGAYFLAGDLPADPAERDDLLLRVLGSPDPRQIDGIGGAHPLTSKVAVVSASAAPDADVDYLFLQVAVDQPSVSDRQNCGNLLAGVGGFAIERGLVQARDGVTPVRIRMLNSDSAATASIPTPGGIVDYGGDVAISGVPGTAGPVVLDFADTAGSACGSLLPTGSALDVVDGALPGTPAHELAKPAEGARFRLEHPTGQIEVEVELDEAGAVRLSGRRRPHRAVALRRVRLPASLTVRRSK